MKNLDLSAIKSPADIRRMDEKQLVDLAAAMRRTLLEKLSAHGGHVGPNLGMIETIIALHHVFNTPEDKIVFDVSHQTYPHKMLTGRMRAFTDPAHYDDVSGYTNPQESDYDLFSLGHTSSAVSLASGLAKARDLKGGKENVIAVIGDGSLSGGVAFEGLDYGATLGTNFIVVVNDNDMSIAENHGGIYDGLRLLRDTNGTADNNLFRAMGFDYRYVHNGNDIPSLVDMFHSVKDISNPVVVHINTMKGMGLPVAEADKEKFHFSAPFDLKTGEPYSSAPEGYDDLFANQVLARMKEIPELIVVNAGTPGAIGFTPERRKKAGSRFVDVGIAEQHAVAMAGGLAKGGARPVVALASTFLQRAYDQFSQDIALNHQPVTFVVFYGSVLGLNDETHLGFFDLGLLSNIPGLLVLTPTCKEEFLAMLRWSQDQREKPVVIRVPGGSVRSDPKISLLDDYSRSSYEIVREGSRIALIGAGTFLPAMQQAAGNLAVKGLDPMVINPREVSTLDTACLDSIKDFDLIITAEDGIIDGGFGQKIASYYGDAAVKVINLGLPKEFMDRYNAVEVLKEFNLTSDGITDMVMTTFSWH